MWAYVWEIAKSVQFVTFALACINVMHEKEKNTCVPSFDLAVVKQYPVIAPAVQGVSTLSLTTLVIILVLYINR